MKLYPEIYDELLANWQGRAVSFLEIGVFKGASLRMWRDFFRKLKDDFPRYRSDL